MKCANARKLDRKSGVRLGERRAPVLFPLDFGVPDGVLPEGGGVLLRRSPFFVDGGVVQGRAGQVFRGEDGSVFLGPGYLQRRVVP
jgi:hypothetical protein